MGINKVCACLARGILVSLFISRSHTLLFLLLRLSHRRFLGNGTWLEQKAGNCGRVAQFRWQPVPFTFARMPEHVHDRMDTPHGCISSAPKRSKEERDS